MKNVQLIKWVLLILSQFLQTASFAQINIGEYFFDTDPGIGNGYALNSLNVSSGTQYDSTNFSGTIFIPANMQPGRHTVYVRFADTDSNGHKKWSQCEARKIFILSSGQSIIKAEYFFDNDPGAGNGTNIAITGNTDSSSFSGNINTNGLGTGFHNVYMRVKNILGQWSNYETKKISILPSGNSITQAEYFFDTDPGVGNATNISITGNADSSIFSGNLNTAGLAIGFHNVYIRTKKFNGPWSHCETRKIFVLSTGIGITKAEYFFDTDPGIGNGISIPITGNTDSSIFSGNLNTTTLTPGRHQVCIRTQSATGKWSVYETRKILVLYNGNAIPKAEYFVDTDPGVGNGSPIILTPISNSENEYSGNISFSPSLSGGYHLLYMRALDHLGQWGLADTGITFFNCKVPDIPSISATSPSNCGIANITLSINSGALQSAAYWSWYEGSCNGQFIDTGNTIIVSPYDTTTYFVRGEGGGCFNYGSCASQVINANPLSTIRMKLFLEGYADGGGTMKPVLFNEGVNIPDNICDSITVELHDTLTYALIAQQQALLKTNGEAIVNFCPLQGSYYVAIKHRNAVETWSAQPVTLSNQLSQYDFSTASSKAYASNMVEIEPGLWAFYTGDINRDENIDLLDVSVLENDINNFEFGYFNTDLNGDGNVDLLDSPILENNINNFIFSIHP